MLSTIQELVSQLYNYRSIASKAATVFEHALAVSLILGFKEIFIQGIDLPSTKLKKRVKKSEINVKYGELGYKYETRIDKKILDKISKIQRKTDIIINRKSKKIFLKKYTYFEKLTYYMLILKNKFFEKKSRGFKNNLNNIIVNIRIYSDIAKSNRIKIFNLSEKSNLNMVKNIEYLKF